MKSLQLLVRDVNVKIADLLRQKANTPALTNLLGQLEVLRRYSKPSRMRNNRLRTALENFNNAESSTIEGMRNIINRRNAKFLQNHPDLEASKIGEVFDVFKSYAYRLAEKGRPDSEQIVTAVISAIKSGLSGKEIADFLDSEMRRTGHLSRETLDYLNSLDIGFSDDLSDDELDGIPF